MKNWQQRWFVLRGDQLFYYKDKDESKPQGFISLQGTQVTELLPDPEDPGKHLFEITPGGATEREKVPAMALGRMKQKDCHSLTSACFTQKVQGQPGLNSESLSQNKDKNKR